MTLHAEFSTEMAKQVGPGWAAASDILRLEIMDRFGGFYTDGDNVINDLGAAFAAATNHEDGFAVNPIPPSDGRYNNSAMIMPARHPFAVQAKLSIGQNYRLNQNQLYPPMDRFRRRDEWITEEQSSRRNSIMFRTGPEAYTKIAREKFGLNTAGEFPQLPGVENQSDLSWHPFRAAQPRVWSPNETEQFTARVIHTMVRSIYNRNGDLHLTAISDAIRRHSHPDMIWRAAIRFIASRSDLRELIRGVTILRVDFDGTSRYDVHLPDDVKNMFRLEDRRTHRPPIGDSQGWWLGEKSLPATMTISAARELAPQTTRMGHGSEASSSAAGRPPIRPNFGSGNHGPRGGAVSTADNHAAVMSEKHGQSSRWRPKPALTEEGADHVEASPAAEQSFFLSDMERAKSLNEMAALWEGRADYRGEEHNRAPTIEAGYAKGKGRAPDREAASQVRQPADGALLAAISEAQVLLGPRGPQGISLDHGLVMDEMPPRVQSFLILTHHILHHPGEHESARRLADHLVSADLATTGSAHEPSAPLQARGAAAALLGGARKKPSLPAQSRAADSAAQQSFGAGNAQTAPERTIEDHEERAIRARVKELQRTRGFTDVYARKIISAVKAALRSVVQKSEQDVAELVTAIYGAAGQRITMLDDISLKLAQQPILTQAIHRHESVATAVHRQPDLATLFPKFPRVLESVAAFGLSHTMAHDDAALSLLASRPDVLAEAEKDIQFWNWINTNPPLLSALDGRVELIRVVVSSESMTAIIGDPMRHDLRTAVLSLPSAKAVKLLSNFTMEAGLLAGLRSATWRAPQLSFDLSHLLTNQQNILERLRPYSQQAIALFTIPGLYESTLEDLSMLKTLNRSVMLTDILEDIPAFGARIIKSPALMNAAVENINVARHLSRNPTHFDRVYDASLLMALKDARPPEDTSSGQPPTPAEIASLPAHELVNKLLGSSREWLAAVGSDGAVRQMLQSRRDLLTRLAAAPPLPAHVLRRFFSPASSNLLDVVESGHVPISMIPSAVKFQHLDALNTDPRFLGMRHLIAERSESDRNFHSALQNYPAFGLAVIMNYSILVATGDPRFFSALLTEPRLASAISHLQSYQLHNLVRHHPELTGALLSHNAALLRLFYADIKISDQIGLILNDTPKSEKFRSWLRDVDSSLDGLNLLLNAGVDLPTGHWVQLLLDGRLLRNIAEKISRPGGRKSTNAGSDLTTTAQVLARSGAVLREAVSRTGRSPRRQDFVQAWSSAPEQFDHAARMPAGAKKRYDHLIRRIRESGPMTVSQNGFILDIARSEAVETFALWTQSPAGSLGDALSLRLPQEDRQLIDTLVGRAVMLRNNPGLLAAVHKERYLAQGIMFKRGLYETLVSRPSLVDLISHDTRVLHTLMLDDHLAELLGGDDELFKAYTLNVNDFRSAIAFPNDGALLYLRNNPDWIRAFAGPGGRELVPGRSTPELSDLVGRSGPAARAIAKQPAILDTLRRNPELARGLVGKSENVIAASLASHGRAEALAGNIRLIGKLTQLPAVSELLARHVQLFPAPDDFRQFLNSSSKLMQLLEKYPQIAEMVLLQRGAWSRVSQEREFIEAMAQVSNSDRAKLITPHVLELFNEHPGLAKSLGSAQNSHIRDAILHVRGLVAALAERRSLLAELQKHPELVTALRGNLHLVDDAIAKNSVWQALLKNPSLATHTTPGLHRILAHYRNLTEFMGENNVVHAQSARLTAQSLVAGHISKFLDEDLDFAAVYFKRGEWQEHSVRNPEFAEVLRTLDRKGQLPGLIADSDPAQLLRKVTRTARRSDTASGVRAVTATGTRPAAVGQQSSHNASAMTAERGLVARPAVDHSRKGRTLAGDELADLFASRAGRLVAGALPANPELLPLLQAMPSVAEFLTLKPEDLNDYLFVSYLKKHAETTDASFERVFASYLEHIDATPGIFYDTIKLAAQHSWSAHHHGRAQTVWREKVEQNQRFTLFRSQDPLTWEMSGNLHFSGEVTEKSFTPQDLDVLTGIAKNGTGQREARSATSINRALHAHIGGGSGGVSFFYALTADGRVDTVVYSHSRRRQAAGNGYYWDNGSHSTNGPKSLEFVHNDRRLVASRELAAAPVPPFPAQPTARREGVPDPTAGAFAAAVTDYHDSLSSLISLRSPQRQHFQRYLDTANSLNQGFGIDIFGRATETLPEAVSQARAILTRPGKSSGAPQLLGAIATLVHHSRQHGDPRTAEALGAALRDHTSQTAASRGRPSLSSRQQKGHARTPVLRVDTSDAMSRGLRIVLDELVARTLGPEASPQHRDGTMRMSDPSPIAVSPIATLQRALKSYGDVTHRHADHVPERPSTDASSPSSSSSRAETITTSRTASGKPDAEMRPSRRESDAIGSTRPLRT
ncbi:hypothetical protein ACWGJX_43615 [Streptomyces sp. NPDC054775]